jgi:DNA-directed RNA polymerase subunit RPC12/RpoP
VIHKLWQALILKEKIMKISKQLNMDTSVAPDVYVRCEHCGIEYKMTRAIDSNVLKQVIGGMICLECGKSTFSEIV